MSPGGGGGEGGAVKWSMHAQIKIFLSRRGVQAQRQENSFDSLMFVLGFFSPKFSGDAGRGPTIYEGGPNANFYRI